MSVNSYESNTFPTEKKSKPSSTRFQRGNTYGKGRPVGSKSKAQVAIEAISLESCVAVMRKAVSRALEGDVGAMKLILDRVYPTRKGTRIKLDLPCIESYEDFIKASNSIINFMADGIISPQEAMQLSHVYSRTLTMWDLVDLSQRVKALEIQAAKMQGKPYYG